MRGTSQGRRLTQPMVRVGGELRPATWDEALDAAAGGFARAVEAGGPDAFGMFSCSKATVRAPFDAAWGSAIPPRPGKHLTAMFEAMGSGELRAVYCLGRTRPSRRPTPADLCSLAHRPR